MLEFLALVLLLAHCYAMRISEFVITFAAQRLKYVTAFIYCPETRLAAACPVCLGNTKAIIKLLPTFWRPLPPSESTDSLSLNGPIYST